ncbi:MAG: tetratricopeptide repeat protein [Candidatus Treponema excrementipullorum]|nr:tetratricopeptide repeat protein [Candidatus Treponema excrementipullorum]
MDFYEEAEKYFIAGMKCYLDKDYEGVKKYFTKAIESGANDRRVYIGRGFACMDTRNYAEAIKDFTQAIKLGANNKHIYDNRGRAHVYEEKYTEAIDDFTEAIKLGLNDKGIYKRRGLAYVGAKKYTEAIADCTTAIELGENDKVIYIIRGIAYIGKKDYTEAINDFKEVIKLNKSGNEKENTTGGDDHISNKISLTDNILNLIFHLSKSNESSVLPIDETLNLIELVYYCYDLMEEIKIKPSELEEKIVHYTKASTLQHLLKKDHSAKLRLNNAVYMNDPEEGQILKRVLCQLDKNNELENLLKDTEDIKNYTYLTCFSPYDKRDELPMWIHYGAGGKGVGLVFNSRFFDKTYLYSVIYIDVKNPDIKKLNQNLQDKITAILNLLQEDDIRNNDHKEFKFYVNIILNYVSYLFKDKAYEYENEVRMLNYRNYDSQDIKTDDAGRDIPRLYTEYDECITDKNCVEVIAGPKANYTEIAAYAKYVGIQKVSQSEIKYR